MDATMDYVTHIDSRKRITLRGASFDYYHVREFVNGCITLEPRELVAPAGISSQSMEAMDRAVENFNLNKVSDPIDLSDF